MAYDGIVVAATVHELNTLYKDGTIVKIAEPAKDELILTIKAMRQNYRLLISVDPSMPSVYMIDDNVLSPVTAPNFCMSLRKHIGGGRIRRVFQPAETLEKAGLERIIVFEIEHLNELGDTGIKYLITELMGKYSNIILVNDKLNILDSIKHISAMQSSVREVLPGHPYFVPATVDKKNPLELADGDAEGFAGVIGGTACDIVKSIYTRITGISPTVAYDIVYRAGVSAEKNPEDLEEREISALFDAFRELMLSVRNGEFLPNIIYDNGEVDEFSGVELKSLSGGNYSSKSYDSMMEVIRFFYGERAKRNRIRCKSDDMRRLIKQLTERTSKKLSLQEKQLEDADKMDKYRVYGELINTYGYELKGGEKQLKCLNYYDNDSEISIPLDGMLSARENAKKYFDKYTKLKRTKEALIPQIEEGKRMLYHLESIDNSMLLAETEADLNELRREMSDAGYLKKQASKGRQRKEDKKTQPMHFVSSDGIDIYVGRNNFQNEELSFKVAEGNDWWFHAKNVPGSHVIAKTGNTELPDATCLEAAALAAYYSSAGRSNGRGGAPKIEVDYVQKKALKRVPGAQPGYVIYHTNYSIMIEPKAEI